jgi:hypothetical protein
VTSTGTLGQVSIMHMRSHTELRGEAVPLLNLIANYITQ